MDPSSPAAQLRFLEFDLSSGSGHILMASAEWSLRYLGGKVLAARILWEKQRPGLDPLDPETLLVFTTGILTGSGAPSANRFNVSCKNLLTGGILSSNCGGDFGMYLRRAGFNALILRGRSSSPCWLEIDERGGRLHEAPHLWGLDTVQIRAEIPSKTGWVAIGPAGENLVRYAAILSGDRVAGRGGVGAVMGSKNLKLITASGARRLKPHDPEAFRSAVRSHIRILKEHPLTGEMLPRYGTAAMVVGANATRTLPTRNFQAGTFEHADDVSGEALAEHHLAGNTGCTGCTIRCARMVRLGDQVVKGPEYETLGMFGPNMGNRDLGAILAWNELADRLGMDTISLGSTLASAMELKSRGLFPELPVSFDSIEGMESLMEDIAFRRGIGDELAEGAMRLCRARGAPELAMHAKGMEFAAYEPRGAVGHGLGYAVSNRGGCHINGGYVIFFEALGLVTMDPLTPHAKPGLVVLQQNLLEAVSAAGGCIFTTYAIIPPLPHWLYNPHGRSASLVNCSLKASRFALGAQSRLRSSMLPFHIPLVPHTTEIQALTGLPVTLGRFIEAGERGYTLERLFNLREGLLANEDSLPPRLTDEAQQPGVPASRVPLREMLPIYYKTRGWSPAGIPTPRLLTRLGLQELSPFVVALQADLPRLGESRANFLKGKSAFFDRHLQSSRAAQSLARGQREALRQSFQRARQIERALLVRGSVFDIDQERCRACGLCAKACPVGAITWERRHRARIDPEKCVRCGLCLIACPPHFAAVRALPAERARDREPIRYRVKPESCAKCGICAKACPAGAITWSKRNLAHIDPELCVACGLCERACPPKFLAIERVALPSDLEKSP